MANTRTMEQELRYIENFLDNLSVEDFEEMIVDCGYKTIKSSEQSTQVKEMYPKC